MSRFVLDASALLALLNDEPGADRVEELLSESIMSTLNLAEAAGRLAAAGMPGAQIREVLAMLGLKLAPFTEEHALVAGLLHPRVQAWRLSLGDRACIALAQILGVPAVTADRVWGKVDIGVEVILIRDAGPETQSSKSP